MSSLGPKGTPFWPSSEGTAGLDDGVETASWSHVHSVDIGFSKKGCWSGDGRGNANLRLLAELTFMAGFYEPLDVTVKGRPPELVSKEAASRVDSFVA